MVMKMTWRGRKLRYDEFRIY